MNRCRNQKSKWLENALGGYFINKLRKHKLQLRIMLINSSSRVEYRNKKTPLRQIQLIGDSKGQCPPKPIYKILISPSATIPMPSSFIFFSSNPKQPHDPSNWVLESS